MMDVLSDVAAARAVIAAPHIHTTKGLRRAVDCLLTYGDWMDVERARLLSKQLDREVAELTPGEVAVDLAGAVALFAGLFAGFWLGCGMGWQ